MITIKLKLLSLSAITILLTSTAVISAPWIPSGLGGGGGLEQPTISPHNPNKVFLSSDMSGVYKSDNFGQNWTMLNYRTDNQLGINDRGRTAPIQFTNNPNILYATNRDTYPP